MAPTQLDAESFSSYPLRARKLAADNVALLRQLPLAFVPFLLKEIISYDWKFPAERNELIRQLGYLRSLSPEENQRQMAVFAKIGMSPQLERYEWVKAPAQFLEKLSAHLWATHQLDSFRAASQDYIQKFYAVSAQELLPISRLSIVVIGRGVAGNRYALFHKLRRQGVYFKAVNPDDGLRIILDAVQARANAHPLAYGHWYIDGGANVAVACDNLTCVAYQSLASVRALLSNKLRSAFESPNFSAEELRTTLAQMSPEDLGLTSPKSDPVLDRFQMSLLTEGSGTQIFSTTFVQWTAREVLRRAQPLTLLARFAPRQREKPMNELLAAVLQHKPETDAQGSLIDGDMGAYYTWLNQQRLSGADRSSFLVWFENHNEAVAISPWLPRDATENTTIDMQTLLKVV